MCCISDASRRVEPEHADPGTGSASVLPLFPFVHLLKVFRIPNTLQRMFDNYEEHEKAAATSAFCDPNKDFITFYGIAVEIQFLEKRKR
jgi:hypothetical protein